MPTNKKVFNYKHLKFKSRTGYSNNLLKPGYGGELGDDEIKAIKAELERLPGLRKVWGFKESERITKKKIQEIAMIMEEEEEEPEKKG